MREVPTRAIAECLKNIFLETAFRLSPKILSDMEAASQRETGPQAKGLISILLQNNKLAAEEGLPLCQDTGLPQVLIELGQDVRLTGAPLKEAVEEGVRAAYREGYLRLSACHPISRQNLGFQIPVSLETVIASGDSLVIRTLAKGGGCDNRSQLLGVPTTGGRQKILEAALSALIEAGPDACPPFYAGIAIGGTFESAPRLSRLALLYLHRGPPMEMEEEDLAKDILDAANRSGLGPGCLGGKTTALGLRVKIHPTHIASLPVAVNICCHSFRPGYAEL
jgi:fumarate hydratase subunit alpha